MSHSSLVISLKREWLNGVAAVVICSPSGPRDPRINDSVDSRADEMEQSCHKSSHQNTMNPGTRPSPEPPFSQPQHAFGRGVCVPSAVASPTSPHTGTGCGALVIQTVGEQQMNLDLRGK